MKRIFSHCLRGIALVLSWAVISACSTTSPNSEALVPTLTDNEVLIESIEQYGIEVAETDPGVLIYLPTLTFEYNSTEPTGEAKHTLNVITRICNLEIARHRRISISGHADAMGTAENNLKVSKVRATTVRDLMQSYGLDSSRIELQWFGDSRPLIPNKLSNGQDNPEGRARNRRVEILIQNLEPNAS